MRGWLVRVALPAAVAGICAVSLWEGPSFAQPLGPPPTPLPASPAPANALGIRPSSESPADPQPQAPEPKAAHRIYSLAECIALAERNFPGIGAANARLSYMREQLAEARTAPFSQFTALAGVGPAPTLRGNSLYSPNTDVSLNSDLGLGWNVKVEGFVPLWTFGKITNLWRAAEAQVEYGEADIRKQRNSVQMDVRRAYYGLKLARDGIALLNEATGQLDKALDHLRKELAEGNGDEIDGFKLSTLRYELEARRAEARKYETIALAGLRFLTGVSAALDVSDTPLRPVDRPLLPVSQYLLAARIHRPEVNMLRAGIAARQAQVDLARAKYFPDLVVGAFFDWRRAPQITDQISPFVRDDANYLRYGVAAAMRWQLDLLPNAARVGQAQAQLEELRYTERMALGAVGVDVESAYAQVVDAVARERSFGSAQKMARKWLVTVQQGIEVGTREDADLVDPARQWAMQRYYHLNAILDLNMAWAGLALATGWNNITASEG